MVASYGLERGAIEQLITLSEALPWNPADLENISRHRKDLSVEVSGDKSDRLEIFGISCATQEDRHARMHGTRVLILRNPELGWPMFDEDTPPVRDPDILKCNMVALLEPLAEDDRIKFVAARGLSPDSGPFGKVTLLHQFGSARNRFRFRRGNAHIYLRTN